MYKVGITGGIGSGKSTVAEIFKQLGVAVYSSDERAKYIMAHNEILVAKITALFGENSYINGVLNRAYIAKRVFTNKSELEKLNEIVHPVLKSDFESWCKQQTSVYILKEAAILFESKANIGLNKVVLVTAPQDLKIERVVTRDHSTHSEVLSRMDKQWSDEQKRDLADFEIINDEGSSLIEQVLTIHQAITVLVDKV